MPGNYFDTVARLWSTDERKNRTFSIYHQLQPILADVPRPCRALEIGSGDGLLAALMSEHFTAIDCVDASAGMREVAAERFAAMALSHIAIHDERFPEAANKTYDVIYSLTAFHHIRDIEGELSLLRRLLKPDGLLLIMDLTPVSPEFHANFPNFDGHHGFSRETVQNLLRCTRFTEQAYKLLWKGHHHNTDFGIFLAVARRDDGGC